MPGLMMPDGELLEREIDRSGTTGPSIVILYNCDCHAFDEVVLQIEKATGFGLEKAEAIALEAHLKGRAIAFSGESDECERVAAVLRAIKLQVETDRS
jgi:ATP-dependent Clp protease adapter protein ClpS